MNKARRTEIEKALGMIDEAKSIIEAAASEEREYFDAMPEGFQNGERGAKADEAANALEEALSALEEAVAQAQAATE